MTYFTGAGRLLMDKFSAKDARLVSRSPVSKALPCACVVDLVLLDVGTPCVVAGCSTPPSPSNPLTE